MKRTYTNGLQLNEEKPYKVSQNEVYCPIRRQSLIDLQYQIESFVL